MKVRIYCHSVKVKAAQMMKLRNLLRAMHVSFFAFNLQEPECLFWFPLSLSSALPWLFIIYSYSLPFEKVTKSFVKNGRVWCGDTDQPAKRTFRFEAFFDQLRDIMLGVGDRVRRKCLENPTKNKCFDPIWRCPIRFFANYSKK